VKVSVIVAMAANGVIGRNNDLPWRLPADLARFRRLTMGHGLIVGRRTWESIGRPLPGRAMIVLTSRDGLVPPGVAVARSLDEALRLAPGEEVFVGGGAAVYSQAIPLASRLHITRIERDVEGDTVFPAYDARGWRLLQEERHEAAGDQPAYAFQTWERDKGGTA
jgi:dihydrofolate reductase